MANFKGTTKAQTRFLRALAKNPLGPPPDDWPGIVALRRWLRRPAFRRALDSLLDALRFRSDLHLAYAATTAAQTLQQPPDDPDKAEIECRKSKMALLKLVHLRQHNHKPPLPDAAPLHTQAALSLERQFLRTVHPDTTVRDALDYLDRYPPQPTPANKQPLTTNK